MRIPLQLMVESKVTRSPGTPIAGGFAANFGNRRRPLHDPSLQVEFDGPW